MSDDLISRQAAICLLEHEIELSNRALDFAELVGTEREKFSWGLGLLESIAEDIKQLPSAEPEWIQVTEQLPKENGDYLVTGRHGAVNKRKYEDGRWYGNWAIVAWMPLPAPWKGEDDDN